MQWTEFDQTIKKSLYEYFGDDMERLLTKGDYMDFFRNAHRKEIAPDQAFLDFMQKYKSGNFRDDGIRIIS